MLLLRQSYIEQMQKVIYKWEIVLRTVKLTVRDEWKRQSKNYKI